MAKLASRRLSRWLTIEAKSLPVGLPRIFTEMGPARYAVDVQKSTTAAIVSAWKALAAMGRGSLGAPPPPPRALSTPLTLLRLRGGEK